MALLAPPVTCELGNERRGGAVIYITNVRVRRTWTPLISPRLISLSDQMGMHNTSDGHAEKQMCWVISLSPSSSSWMFGSVVSNCQSFPEAANRL
ncbi:hypothetical protein NQZ68_008020 [Dissostichus eleginoides]|nr:hypothetical protein NQZ68_008020 [Dissostichus eleginoides]